MDWHTMELKFLLHTQCSQDMLQNHHDPDQDKMDNEDEWMICFSTEQVETESQTECNIEILHTRDSFGSEKGSQQHPRELNPD